MTDQEYIHLKQQQKKRSRKLKKDRERWIEEEDKENGIYKTKQWCHDTSNRIRDNWFNRPKRSR